MNSVNISQEDSSKIRVPNLFKKLGISNNTALKPPLPKNKTSCAKKPPRRNTVQVPSFPDAIKNLQRSWTYKPHNHRSSSSLSEQSSEETVTPTRNLTPKSRFISNWIKQKQASEKVNSNINDATF